MMAYKKNFVVAVKHNGRILREIDEVVTLPFGSEYSILLKNKDSRRAVANIEIDGQDVVDGNSVIVEPNTTVELTGFMKGMAVRNRFRFIKKTKQISNYRGDRIDDGLVRVEFRFERHVQELPKVQISQPDGWWGSPPNGRFIGGNTLLKSSGGDNNVYYSAHSGGNFGSVTCNMNSVRKCPDDGITVKGSETYQDFSVGSTKELEKSSTVITLKLRGTKNKRAVTKAVGVKTRLACTTCGKKSRSSAKCCSRCGTYLH